MSVAQGEGALSRRGNRTTVAA